jgi:hypothetical protein
LAAGISDTRQFDLPFVPDSLRFTRVEAYDRIEIAGQERFVRTHLIGKPGLPVFRVRVLVPQDAEVTEATVSSLLPPVVLPGRFLPLPVQPDSAGADEVVVDGDRSVYDSEVPYPANRVWLESVTYMRGMQYATFAVTPCEWVGATRELRVYPVSTLRVAWAPQPGRRETIGVRMRERAGRRWTRDGKELAWLERRTLNFDDLDNFTAAAEETSIAFVSAPAGGFVPTDRPSALEGSGVEYVIITDTKEITGRVVGDMVSEFQRLADWKNSEGRAGRCKDGQLDQRELCWLRPC